jgi:hypothetical protein
MSIDAVIASAARSIASLAPALTARPEQELSDISRGIARGHFTPDEDERIRERFAQYLTARAAMLQTIADLKPIALSSADDRANGVSDDDRLRAFAIAYAAAALLVRAARFIVDDYAGHKIIQRKLNEAEPRFGLPRKQFTAVYRAMTSPLNGWQLADAARFAAMHRDDIESLADDSLLAPVLCHLRESESAIQRSTRDLVTARLRYRWHSLRRRRASAFQHALFGLFEVSGRVIADMRNPWHVKRVTPEIITQLGELLQPGDAIVTRHDDAMSNFFLPGYWIHSSLHIGTEDDRRRLGVRVDPPRESRWTGPIRALEARKDGVLLRALADTLSVDAVAVIRPRLSREHIADGLSRALTHEGKLYDFEFDFFRSDRLVCTEVVYRAFHGVGGLEFPITRRAGRPTLSSEDLLRMALEDRGYEAVAVFGAPGCEECVARGNDAQAALSSTLRSGAP